jgi:hypothetical protein
MAEELPYLHALALGIVKTSEGLNTEAFEASLGISRDATSHVIETLRNQKYIDEDILKTTALGRQAFIEYIQSHEEMIPDLQEHRVNIE